MRPQISFTKTIAGGLIIYLSLIFVYRLSATIGGGTKDECAAAIAAIAVSWIISLMPHFFVKKNGLTGFVIVFIAASFIRLAVLSIIIILMIKNWQLQQTALLLWTAAIYAFFLIIDTSFKVQYIRNTDWQQEDIFEKKRNEIYINNTKSS